MRIQRVPAPELTCPYLRGDPKRSECNMCGKPLTGRQTRWCSRTCMDWWEANHLFATASAFVRSSAEVYSLANERTGYACWVCGDVAEAVEIDHVARAHGLHWAKSCVHHLDNLRAACVTCHRRITRRQLGAER